MLNNVVVNELRGRDRNMFRALNQCFGFDFQKDFSIAKIEGNFTINKALKAVNDGLSGTEYHFPASSTIVILTVRNDKYAWCRDDIRVVEVKGSSDFSIELHKKWFNFKTMFDNHYSKGDFNEWRKDALCCYVIAQKKELLARKWEKSEPGIKERWTAEQIKGIERGYRKEWEFDKSGYCVSCKQRELIRRARELRCERKANEFRATDNTETIKELKERLSSLKADIVKALSIANTAENIRIIEKSLSWYKGLGDCFEKIEYIEKKDNEKSFSSVDEFNKRVNDLNDMMTEIKDKIA